MQPTRISGLGFTGGWARLDHRFEQAGMRVARRDPLQVHFRGHMIGSFFADIIVDRTDHLK